MLQYKPHKGVAELIKALNKLYKKEPALYEKQFHAEGFEWIDFSDATNSVLVYMRKGKKPEDNLIIACNMTPVPRENYRIGLPKSGQLKEVFNSDLKKYFGSGDFKNKSLEAEKIKSHGRDFSAEIIIPPLGMVVFKYQK